MGKPMVSVIVPVYNVSAFLPACLESLLGQTLDNIEVLCVDDASTDDSARVVEAFAEKDPRVRLLRQEHRGVSAARNLGLDQAQGEYIAFVDADDRVEKTMLETLLSRIGDGDVAVCSAQVKYCDDSRREPLEWALTVTAGQWQQDEEESLWQCLDRNGSWPFVWNKLYRASLLREKKIRFSTDLSLGEDGAFLVLLWQYARKIVFLEEKLYHYRYQRKDSATVRLFQDGLHRFRQHIDVVRVLSEEFSDRELMEHRGAQLLSWVIRFLYYDFVRLPAQARRGISEELKEVLQKQGLLWFETKLRPFERRRLGNLVWVDSDCTALKRSWDIWRLRIENRLIK